MAIKEQTIVLVVTFDEEKTYENSAAEAISDSLYHEKGVHSWGIEVVKEREIKIGSELNG